MTRVITAIVGIPILVYLIKFAPPSVFVGACLAAMLISLYEYFQLTRAQGDLRVAWPAFAMATLIFLSFYFVHSELQFYFPAGAVLVLLVALFSGIDMGRALQATAFALFGAWYVGGLMGYLVGVRMIEAGSDLGANLTLLLFVVIWAGDSFAYLFGRWIGRHKLAAVSPKKTVEGAVAGLVFSVLSAVLIQWGLIPQITRTDAIVLGMLVGLAGQVGDLCESLLKRSAGVKDSGGVIPGHGGMLDRLDSLLFGAPAMYYYFYLVLRK